MASLYSNNLETCVASNQLCKSVGIKLSPNAQVVQIARNVGFDSLFIDLEQAWLTLAEASNLCNVGHLCGITPFVRVPYQWGAMGIIFPHIHNAADAKAAVSISKYPLLGCRSMTGQMPVFGMRGTTVDETIDFCNKFGSTVFAMAESKEAVESADEIAAVDVVLVGSMDLTIDLGIGGKFEKPEYRLSLDKISQACRTHGKVFGVAGVYDNPELQSWIINELEARFMLVQQDSSLISAGGIRAVSSLPLVK
ncbi:Pyruvate/Phosphoenolpyruvate kinase-like domain-containing protein [Aspergillus crustosus]